MEGLSEVQDAQLVLGLVETLENISDWKNVVDQLDYLRTIITNTNLKYTTLANVLSIIVSYTYPVSTPVDKVANMAKVLCEKKDEKNEHHQKAVESTLSEDVIINTVSELIAKVSDVGIEPNDSREEVLFKFIKAKVLHCAKYGGGIGDAAALFTLIPQYEPFIAWHNGVFKPFQYYWDNYGCLNSTVDFEQLTEMNSSEVFDTFISPLKESNQQIYGDKLSIRNWMFNVIVPSIVYNNHDFGPLLNWLFRDNFNSSVSQPSYKYEVWNKTIRSVIESRSLDFDHYSVLIQYFLGAVYYYALYETPDLVSSIEITRIYDLINDTLGLIKTEKGPLEYNISYEKVKEVQANSVVEFVNPKNPLAPLFEPNGHSISTLKVIIDTCRKLFPMNRLCISRYLQLKFSEESSDVQLGEKKREINRIIANINGANYTQLLKSVDIFCESFVSGDQSVEINELIMQRLVNSNLFDIVYVQQKSMNLPNEILTGMVLEKFWDSYNTTSSFNDKSGTLFEATQAIKLIEKLTPEVPPKYRNEIVGIKHLLKAIANLKNFRLANHNKPLTPHILITKYKPETSQEGEVKNNHPLLSLITLILEMNPKSYLAFEKLYRILNDLMLYFNYTDQLTSGDLDSDASTFNKVKAACIESALIDGNFQYAYKQSIELFEHKANLDDSWLTFYQVGKFVSLEDPDNISVLVKQREILTLSLERLSYSASTKEIMRQWEVVNTKIENYYREVGLDEVTTFDNYTMSSEFKENIGAIANEIINEATTTTNQASEKLSKMFVSGLGWAIGARSNK